MVWSVIEPGEPEGAAGANDAEAAAGADDAEAAERGADPVAVAGHVGDPRQVGGHPDDGGHPRHPGHVGDQTRARILDVALELIADRGFAATSTREIAERLGLTKAALYYHFRTKDDLLAAIVGTVMADLETLAERGQGARTPEERRGLVEGYVHLVQAHADLIRVLASDPSVKQSAGLHDAMPIFRRLGRPLAGTDEPDAAQRIRVRAALMAIHGVLVYAQPGEDPEVSRAAAIDAACAVLGLPRARQGERGAHGERGDHGEQGAQKDRS
jgi:AcrR family transcriptional regulator